MKKYSFNLGTTTLEIITPSIIKESDLDVIFKLIQFIRYDFNHIIHNSSAYRLNSAGINVPVLVTPEFKHYLKTNIFECDKSDQKFLPFYKKHGKIEKDSMINVLKIEENIVKKESDILFKSNLILQPYLIDLIFEKVKTLKIKSFLLSTKNYHRCFGSEIWDVSLEIEPQNNYTTKICNAAIGIHFIATNEEEDNKNFFANSDSFVNPLYAIMPSKTCIDSKISSLIIKTLRTESALKRFAKETKQSFILVDEDLKTTEFKS
ncbi:hypothetical protein KC669_00350 [Candidatus Dojkabacteria bacterium]|uniref:Uncharacterized protein n=1 Tax=Candidatus Dojkabacteria bacterium TaxID=2099670 RepID=A0A955L9B8_9BACT|nr:hypothetical protein [Candidatus Dojkabacteria bacterium]